MQQRGWPEDHASNAAFHWDDFDDIKVCVNGDLVETFLEGNNGGLAVEIKQILYGKGGFLM